jgi:glycosyltransferase involved in cell wall biosynthesis
MNQEQKWKNYSKLRIKLVSLLEKAAFKYGDAIIVTTPQMKAEVIKRHNILPGKITIIPNSVNVDIFKPMPESQQIERRIGFVGRFTGQKRIPLLIEAVSKIKDASLLLIGDGPLKKEIEDQAKQLGINVDFMGNVPNYQLPDLLNSCQTFVLPSEWEGMPKALLEAMACGLPVIGTDAPGICDVIKHDHNGILCKPDPQSIQRSIEQVFNDKQYAHQLGTQARQYIVENFSLNAAVDKEIELLKRIIQV